MTDFECDSKGSDGSRAKAALNSLNLRRVLWRSVFKTAPFRLDGDATWDTVAARLVESNGRSLGRGLSRGKIRVVKTMYGFRLRFWNWEVRNSWSPVLNGRVVKTSTTSCTLLASIQLGWVEWLPYLLITMGFINISWSWIFEIVENPLLRILLDLTAVAGAILIMRAILALSWYLRYSKILRMLEILRSVGLENDLL